MENNNYDYKCVNKFISDDQLTSVKFLKSMFELRNYDLSSLRIFENESHDILELFVQNDQGDNIICLLTPVSNSSKGINKQVSKLEIIDRQFHSDENMFDDLKLPKKNNNIGTSFIENIIGHMRNLQNNIKQIIIVSDNVTPQAFKHIEKTTCDISHFDYGETCILNLTTHVYQPTSYKTLVGFDRKKYINTHPNYKTTLIPASYTDPLVKLYGNVPGDIIELVSEDDQVGFVTEYFIIVAPLPQTK